MCPYAQVVVLRPIPPLTLELGKLRVCKEGSFDILISKSAFLICERYRDNGGPKRNTAGISYIPHCERRVTGNLTMFSPKSGQESLPYLLDAALARSEVTVAAVDSVTNYVSKFLERLNV